MLSWVFSSINFKTCSCRTLGSRPKEKDCYENINGYGTFVLKWGVEKHRIILQAEFNRLRT